MDCDWFTVKNILIDFDFPITVCIFICTNELEQATNLHKAIPPEKVKNNAVMESKTEHR